MKIFISQPMRGYTDEEISRVRDIVVKYAKHKYGENIEILQSFFKGSVGGNSPLELLGESIKLLAQADVAIFVGYWDTARGCIIEHQCCIAYEIPRDYIHLSQPAEPTALDSTSDFY